MAVSVKSQGRGQNGCVLVGVPPQPVVKAGISRTPRGALIIGG